MCTLQHESAWSKRVWHALAVDQPLSAGGSCYSWKAKLFGHAMGESCGSAQFSARARALSNAFNKLPASYRRINPSERLLENDMGHMESLLVARSY